MLIKVISFLAGIVNVVWINWNATPINTREAAVELGTRVAHSLYSSVVDFDYYSVAKVKDMGEEWRVCFGAPPIPPVDMGNGFFRCTAILGAGPEIRINKSTGKVTSCMLQK